MTTFSIQDLLAKRREETEKNATNDEVTIRNIIMTSHRLEKRFNECIEWRLHEDPQGKCNHGKA